MSGPQPVKDALTACLDVLLRMIPDYLDATGAHRCTKEEHDSAIAIAAAALHGPNRARWPAGLRDAADGLYD